MATLWLFFMQNQALNSPVQNKRHGRQIRISHVKCNHHFDDAQIAEMYAMSFFFLPRRRIHSFKPGSGHREKQCLFAAAKLQVRHVRSWSWSTVWNFLSLQLITRLHPPRFGAIWKSWFRSILHVVIDIISLPSVCFGLRFGEARPKSE